MNRFKQTGGIAAALLLMVSHCGHADVNIYGKGNVSIQYGDQGDSSVTEVVSNASRLGVKGSADITNDLKAIYQFEYQVEVDDDETFKQRNIFLGIEGGFGTVKAGHFDTPLKAAQSKVDLFNDLVGDIKNLVTVNDNRVSNIASYTTPDSSPVAVNIAVIASEEDDVDNGFSGSVAWSSDLLYLAGAVDVDVEAEGTEAYRGVARLFLGPVTVGALIEQFDDGFETTEGGMLSLSYKMGEWDLKAQAGVSDIDEEGGETFSVGVDRKLNKQFKLFGYLTRHESDLGTDDTYAGVGAELKF